MSAIDRAKVNLKLHSSEPLNGEPALDRLVASFVTPQHHLYVRTHGDLQHLDEASYRLRVSGNVARELTLSVDELRSRFGHHTMAAVLQCAGNRRADLQEVKKTAGDPWSAGAIGNACWTGVRLRDVLTEVGADVGAGMQVAFFSSDEIEVEGEKGRFGVSIPVAKAMSDEVLLAWAMDGEALRPEHGFPLRVVVPGYAGVRSAKWVTDIRVQDTAADSPIQRKDYKLFPPSVTKDDVDWDAGLTIDAMPVNSAICQPSSGARLESGPLTLRGWATASERAIRRVDVSTDGGRSWGQAELQQDLAQAHAWTLWKFDTELEKGEHELVVRAFDEAMQAQPAAPDDVWNFAGYLATHRHRIHVAVL